MKQTLLLTKIESEAYRLVMSDVEKARQILGAAIKEAEAVIGDVVKEHNAEPIVACTSVAGAVVDGRQAIVYEVPDKVPAPSNGVNRLPAEAVAEATE